MAGEADKIKGRMKQAAGELTDDDELKGEGEVDEAAGETKEFIDDAKGKAEDAVDNLKDKFN